MSPVYLKLLGCLIANPSAAHDSFAPTNAKINDHKVVEKEERDFEKRIQLYNKSSVLATLIKLLKASRSSDSKDERAFNAESVTTITLENHDSVLVEVYREHCMEINRQAKSTRDLYFVVGMKVLDNAEYHDIHGSSKAKSFQARLPTTEVAATALGLPPTASSSIGDPSTERSEARKAKSLQSGKIPGKAIFALRCMKVEGLKKNRKNTSQNPTVGRQYRPPSGQTNFSGGPGCYGRGNDDGENEDDDDDSGGETLTVLRLGEEYDKPERTLIA